MLADGSQELYMLQDKFHAQFCADVPASEAKLMAWLILLWVVAIALCVGFLTPLTSMLCVVVELTAWYLAGGVPQASQVCAVVVAVALAMLGPGGYSVDARLFGRRQIVFPVSDGAEDE
jgi:uncharacterized membrane protein YphA (DoxX/SURF4 family)